MKSTDKVSTSKAVQIAKEYGVSASKPTIIKWCNDFNIGFKIGDRYYVNKRRLILMLEGKQWQNTKEGV